MKENQIKSNKKGKGGKGGISKNQSVLMQSYVEILFYSVLSMCACMYIHTLLLLGEKCRGTENCGKLHAQNAKQKSGGGGHNNEGFLRTQNSNSEWGNISDIPIVQFKKRLQYWRCRIFLTEYSELGAQMVSSCGCF